MFDVAVSASGSTADAAFLTYSSLIECCKAVGLKALSPLYSGPINKCMNYDPVFATTVPALFGLAALPNNNAEGVVVRCDMARKAPSPLRAGLQVEALVVDAKGRATRPVAKRKAPHFAEGMRAFVSDYFLQPSGVLSPSCFI